MFSTSAASPSARRVMGRLARGVPAALGAGAFATLLLSLLGVDAVPALVTAALVLFAALAGWRPGAALLVLAAAIPVAAWTGRTWDGYVAWPETLAVAFAAGYLTRPLWTQPRARDGLDLPIAFFTAVVLASLAVRLLVLHWTIGGEALWLQIRALLAGRYFIRDGGFRELDAAMRLVEGMVLLRAAASTSAAFPSFAPRLTRWFVAGAAAAASVNLWRIWQGALRTETPVSMFIEYLGRLRYNVHYADVNAAGSYYVMALLVAAGLVISGRRAVWVAAVVSIAASLLLSGSRTAIVAGGLAALVWVGAFLATRGTGRRPHPAAATALLLCIAGVLAVALMLISGRSIEPSTALLIRAELARTTFRMIAARPVFGVGIGEFQERSGAYSSPVLTETLGVPNENAHNNFFQVLGELGLIGCAGFICVLGAAAAWLRHIRRSHGGIPAGVGYGLLAFVLTWLAGHPLLIDEPALLFWLLLGTAAGWQTQASSPGGLWSRPARIAGVLALLVTIASVPLRARVAFAEADLDHRGSGLSDRKRAGDGPLYRTAVLLDPRTDNQR